jgi:D-alanyl-D-alanine carboxypeptidase/D-alanyl-D-alanine-endopeptidase (penicillin-binding protein 4)
MRVMDAGSGRLFFEKRGDALMDPASNQKVLATTTALLRLGPDWRFRTELSGPAPDENGVVVGDIFLRGSGDPTVRASDLAEMAVGLARRGVRRVLGAVVADPRRIGADDAVAAEPSPGPESSAPAATQPAGDSLQGQLSPRAPLLVNHGLMMVYVRPGPHNGPPAVTTNPSDESFIVRNSARTKDGGGRARITVRVLLAGDGKMQVDVAGRIPSGHPGLAFRRRVPHQALYAAVLMRAALASAGITTRDRPHVGTMPPETALLERHESAPLSLLLRRINKDSDNDHAERVLEAAGAEVYGGAATPEKGVRLLREVIGELGLPPQSYVSRNGSGLGHANRITATAMGTLLRALYLDPRVGPEILQSLSVGGVDGTTRNRFKGTLAARRVRAKTGTLNGKSCLSGLVGDGADVVVFSILVEGLRGRSLPAVRGAQVGAVNAIMRYVRERGGERIDLPPGFDQPLATPDFETGEEITESEGEADQPTEPTTANPIDAELRKEREEKVKAATDAPIPPSSSPPKPKPSPAPSSPAPEPMQP